MAPKCISHKVIFSISAVHQHPIGSSLITSGIVLDPLLDKVTTTLPLLLIEIFFAWGTSGYDQGAVYYQPYSINGSNSCYYAYGNKRANLYDQTGKADWGYNAISNGGNIEHLWRHPDSRTRLHVLLQQPRTENLDHQRGKSPTVTIFALSQLGQSS